MSQAEIDRLVAERSLVRESFTDEDVVSMWSKAAASFADANVPGLSTDGAYQSIYRAALQASMATLAAHGLRVKSTANHYKSFYALQKLTDARTTRGDVQRDARGKKRFRVRGEPRRSRSRRPPRRSPGVHAWFAGRASGHDH